VEVREYRCHYKGKTYVLIDTPGFDDSYRSNDEIVESILDWLEKSCRARKLLSGIIYLHRISDVKMQGSSLENLRMFRKLCGFEAMKHVLLVTTFWDQVTDAEGKRRVEELSSNNEFWGRMIQRGSKIKRFSKLSCDADVKAILSAVVPGARCALQTQIEIVDQGKQKNETDAAQDTLKATQLRMSRQLEYEKLRSKKRLERQQQQALQQHQLELERLRQYAAQERQIKEDARLAAEMMEDALIEMQNYTAKQQLREQIQQQQEESQRATARLEQERARAHAQLQKYISSRCYHGDAEERRRCNHCGVKLHKERTHYYRASPTTTDWFAMLTSIDCCHCSDMYSHRNYNQCSSCGFVCRVSGHPAMVRKVTVDYESCILM
jgi:hypothetical protein